MPGLLRLPHHDGSPLHVENDAPRLGDTVTVRMRSTSTTRSRACGCARRMTPSRSTTRRRARPTARPTGGRPTSGCTTRDPLPLPDRPRRRPAVARRQRPGRHRRPRRRRLQAHFICTRPRLGPRRCRLPDLPGPLRVLSRCRPTADAALGCAGRVDRHRHLRGQRSPHFVARPSTSGRSFPSTCSSCSTTEGDPSGRWGRRADPPQWSNQRQPLKMWPRTSRYDANTLTRIAQTAYVVAPCHRAQPFRWLSSDERSPSAG